ncbi:MAG: hypothetical protein AB9856_08195 [Cellulosilyticaceae bacterium]
MTSPAKLRITSFLGKAGNGIGAGAGLGTGLDVVLGAGAMVAFGIMLGIGVGVGIGEPTVATAGDMSAGVMAGCETTSVAETM